ncbi:MAG: exodeoxyribonuclease V subunit gamma [Spirochaetales bacterium]|nr:exodeoxyribonuclease V subunit gamma [Spirochaetales bacterium]
MAFRMIRSTDLAALSRRFAQETTNRASVSLLDPEYIVVQTPGMKKWLALETARQRGSFVRAEMLSPVQLAMKLSFVILRQKEEKSLFEKDVMVWALFRLFHELRLQDPQNAPLLPLGDYLQKDSSEKETRAFSLASSVADLFDQYLLYRPDWLSAWERGARIPDEAFSAAPFWDETIREAQAWQAELWRRLCNQAQQPHRAELFLRIEQALGGPLNVNLPFRVSLFGMSLLPPVFLRIFQALGRHVPVTLYLPVPTLDYWGDQASLRSRLQTPATPGPTGSRLLGEWGKTGRELMDLLLEADVLDEEPLVGAEMGRGLLGALQAEIRGNSLPEAQAIEESSWTIRFARCATPLREVEVLLDLLLESMAEDETLTPADVVILSPQLEVYEPLIDLTFRNAQATRGVNLPFDLADAKTPESLFSRWLNEVLQVVPGRFEADRVFSLWELTRQVLGEPLSDEDRENTRLMVEESGIRWGVSGPDKAEWNLPAESALTWHEGLDRLWSAFCVGPKTLLDDGLYSFTSVPDPDLIADLSRFLGQLQELHDAQKTNQPLDQWSILLNQWVQNVLGEEGGEEREELIKQTAELVENAQTAGILGQPVSFSLVAGLWKEFLQQEAGATRFFTGRVTVADMVPLRSLPYRIVALLGMNAGFPREVVRSDFDLMKFSVRPGDRNPLEADRYLFLETLLSAQDRLIITASGLTDSGDCAPESNAVAALRQVLNEHYTLGGQQAGEAITKIYPLQPSSRRYQDPTSGLVTYDQRWFSPAPVRNTRPLYQWRIPDEPELLENVNTILMRLKDPLTTFLTEGCGVSGDELTPPLPHAELFSLDNLDSWKVRNAQKEALLGNPDALGLLKASGGVPPGRLGDFAVQQESQKTKDRFQFFQELTACQQLSATPWATKREYPPRTWRFAGSVFWVPSGLGVFQVGNLRAHQRLSAWGTHLFANLFTPRTTYFVGLDGHMVFSELSAEVANQHLTTLAQLAAEARRRPLPFFPEFSWDVYTLEPKELADNMPKLWANICSDPWVKRLVDAQDLDSSAVKDEFYVLLEQIYKPMLEASRG